MSNRDVWTDSPWGDMWRHDFWGQEMTHLESHKSFRPLTTLTYRYAAIDASSIFYARIIFTVVECLHRAVQL